MKVLLNKKVVGPSISKNENKNSQLLLKRIIEVQIIYFLSKISKPKLSYTGPPHALPHWRGKNFSKKGNFKAVWSNLI